MTSDQPSTDAEVSTEDAIVEADSGAVESPVDLRGRADRLRVVAFTVLPALAMLLGAVAGFLRWEDASRRNAVVSAEESVAAARDTTTAILSYQADTAEKELNAARDRLTGTFLDEYTKLVNEVVIPGAKEKKISAVAQVPAAASVAASPTQAVALLFVNQTVTMGNDAPTNSASTVKVTLDKVDGLWLVSGFEPV